MNSETNSSLQNLFNEFRQLPYVQKLETFHSAFNIVPFSFLKIDMDIAWFYNKTELTVLTHNLSGEIKSQDLYKKTFAENGTVLVFDIKPRTYSQRIAFNRFLLSLFSSELYTIHLEIPHGYLDMGDNYLSFLIEKRWRMRAVLTETKQYLQNGNFKSDCKHQFLKVFYSGFENFRSQRSINLRVRHKFVELYLYSQGQAAAAYLDHLQNLIEDVNSVLKKKD